MVYEPTERASAADLLNHAYVMALSTDNPTSTATSVVGSGGGTAGSSLVGDPTNTAGSSGLLGAGQQQIHQHQHHQKETVTVVEAGCSSDPAAAVPTEDNLKDVLRGRRADLPDGAAKIR